MKFITWLGAVLMSVVLTMTGLSSFIPVASATATGTGATFVPIAPFRLVDTTTGVGGSTSPLGAGTVRSYTVGGVGGVPSTGVAAVVIDIAALNSSVSGGSAVKAWPTGTPAPSAPNLYFSSANTPRSNTAIVTLGTQNKINLMNVNGTADVNVDVQGYFLASTGPSDGGFVPIAPLRVANSATGLGMPAAPVSGGSAIDVQVTDGEQIPSTATAIFANVEVRDSTITSGGLKLGPGGSSLATSPATVNYTDEGPQTSGLTVKLSASGALRLQNSASSGHIQVRVDVQGYFTGSATEGGTFTALSPATVYSTETTAGATALGPGATRTIQVSGAGSIPGDGSVGSAALNLTAVNWSSNGALTVYDADVEALPTTANITFWYNRSLPKVSSLALTELSAEGSVKVHNSSTQPVDFYLSSQGWFASTQAAEDDGQSGEIGDPVAWSANEYAAEHSVTSAAARDILKDHVAIEASIEDVIDSVPASKVGGSFIEDSTTGAKLAVRLVDTASAGDVAAVESAATAASIDVDVSVEAEMSLDDRRQVVASHAEDWLESIPSIQGMYADEASEDVILQVSDPAAVSAAREASTPNSKIQAASNASTGTSFDDGGVDVVIEPSGELQSSNKGGRNMTSCTSGFPAVAGTSLKVILTAAHCGAQSYFWFNLDGPFSTKYIGRRFNNQADIQWRKPTQHKVEARYFEEATLTGEGTKVLGNARNVQGAFKCHRGKSSGTSCGTLTSVNYKPVYPNACNGVTCDDVFVYVKGPNLRQAQGDSGGPWFLYGYGYGIHMCGQRDGSGSSCYSKLGNMPSNVKILKY